MGCYRGVFRHLDYLCLFLFLLFWTTYLTALNPHKAISQYGHDVWEVEDGLPQNYVNAIVQARNGYLWLGTQDGIVRFDGIRFSPTKNGESTLLKSNVVISLLEDRRGNLWVATDGSGLYRVRNGKIFHYGKNEGFPFASVWSLCEDRNGNVWIGTDGGGLIRFQNGKFNAFTKNEGLLSNSVWAIYEDVDGSLWIGTDNGLNRFENGTLSAITTKDGLSGNFVYPLLRDKKGILWIGTDGGLNSLHNGEITSYSGSNGLPSDSIWALLEDHEGNLWIGSRNGLTRFYDGKFSSYTVKDGLSNDAVWSLCEDREGNLWVGTRGGLNRFRDGSFMTFTSKEGLPGDVASSIFQSSDGTFWFGTDGNGLASFRDGNFTIYNTSNGLSNNSIFSIREDHNQNIWIGTNRGANQLSNGKWTKLLTESIVWSIAVDRSNHIWMGTRNGLVESHDGKLTTYTTANGLSSNEIWEVYTDRNDVLWIGTYNGLNYLKNGKFLPLSSFSRFAVTSLFQDVQGSLWIGTNGDGLYRYQNQKFSHISTKDGLLDDFVFETLEDDLGNFWISSSKGIFLLPKKDLDQLADGKHLRLIPVTFGRADGLKSRVCNDGSYSAWKAKDGRLWFSMMKGITVVDPRTMKHNLLPPPVVIEQVTVNGKPISNELESLQFKEFPPGSEKFEFQYSGLSLTAPEEVKFRYKLEGFEDDWIDAGSRRTAYYTNILPGSYTFRVTAVNNDGVWNSQGAIYSFEVRPRFFQTPVFYALGIVMVALTGFAGYRFRVKQMRSREADLLHLVEDRTRELERTNAMLRQMSYLDALTGTNNRRRFNEVLDTEWRRAYRTRSYFSIIMIDIDLFKAFNDAYGHQAGDNCLKQVASALTSQLRRAGDFISRYGGEEFVIVLPSADATTAVAVAERLRTTVESLGIPHSTSAVKNIVTISLGVATALLERTGAPDQLIEAADRALYRAKAQGRNRMVSESIELLERDILKEILEKP
jgi:diguanylate cyclase (GGDEF)-like protein